MIKTSDIEGLSLHATDGDIGHMEDFYFDDHNWTVRYLVVNTGNWLLGRRVLISPVVVGDIKINEKKVYVSLSRKKIEESPDIDTNQTVSRLMEQEFYNYYGWPYYWDGSSVWGPGMYPSSLLAVEKQEESEPPDLKSEEKETHLRSIKEVHGYMIQAENGHIGHVEDFLVHEKTWTIQYIVVDTRNWLPGKKVLVAPDWIEEVSWAASQVKVDLTREKIKQAPEYDVSKPLTRELENKLYEYYSKEKYWD